MFSWISRFKDLNKRKKGFFLFKSLNLFSFYILLGQDHLSQKFKVSGIPTLVLLDGKDGKEITKEGRGNILDDPKGNNFPWKPKTVFEVLKDVTLINNQNEKKTIDEVKGKVLGLYFSAHWVCKETRCLIFKVYIWHNNFYLFFCLSYV